MNTVTEQTDLAIDKPNGRKDSDGTPAVIKTKPLKDGIKDLLVLWTKADNARADLNSAVKKIAEQSGLLASVVKRLLNARAKDRFAEERNKVEQTQIAFDEVGEE